jgi:hypothetical protein
MNGFFESDLSPESNNYQRIEINLLADFLQDLNAEFEKNHWTVEEGFYYVLAVGLAALQNSCQSRLILPEESVVIDQLQSERIRMHGRYSVMKHQVAKLQQDVNSLEVQLKATQSLWNALRKQSLVDERSE